MVTGFCAFCSTIKLRVWLSYAVIVVALISCTTTYNTISNRDFVNKYNPSKQLLHPEYSLYMNSPKDIRLYFKLFPSEFSFYMNEDSIAFAKGKLFFRVTRDYSSIEIIDSLSKTLVFAKESRSTFLGYVPLDLPEEGNYVIEVFLSDVLDNYTTSSVLDFNVSFNGSPESFMFLSKYGSPNFYNYNRLNDSVRIRSGMFINQTLRGHYFLPDTSLPLSPDIMSAKPLIIEEPDSIWSIPFPDTCLIPINLEGNYYFSDEMGKQGKLLNGFNHFYPYIKTADQMLAGLAYLCTPAEMKEFYSMSTPKLAVDSFWMHRTNDIEKSRELIRIYYNRMQLANYYFNNYKEGWLTDRGMVFIICGAPRKVKTDQDGEHWFYGNNEKDNMTFHFYTEKHPYFGTIYVLDRSEIYSGVWYNGIATWRDGKVFSLNP